MRLISVVLIIYWATCWPYSKSAAEEVASKQIANARGLSYILQFERLWQNREEVMQLLNTHNANPLWFISALQFKHDHAVEARTIEMASSDILLNRVLRGANPMRDDLDAMTFNVIYRPRVYDIDFFASSKCTDANAVGFSLHLLRQYNLPPISRLLAITNLPYILPARSMISNRELALRTLNILASYWPYADKYEQRAIILAFSQIPQPETISFLQRFLMESQEPIELDIIKSLSHVYNSKLDDRMDVKNKLSECLQQVFQSNREKPDLQNSIIEFLKRIERPETIQRLQNDIAANRIYSLYIERALIEWDQNSHRPAWKQVEIWLTQLKSTNEDIRAEALGNMRRSVADGIEYTVLLVAMLQNDDSKIRGLVPSLFAAMGMRDTSPMLIAAQALKDRDENIRQWASSVLIQNGQSHLVEKISEALKDSNPTVQSLAAETLGNFGKEAIKALSMLEKLTKNENETVKAKAIEAIQKIKAGALPPIQK